MSAAERTAPGRPGTAWWVTAAAGLAYVTALAVVLANGSLAWLAVLIAAVGVVAGACVLGPRALARLRERPELLLVLGLVLAGAGWIATGIQRVSYGVLGGWPWRIGGVPLLPAALALLAAAGGLVLIADAVRVRIGQMPRQRAPWRQLTAPAPDSAPALATRAVTGVLLVGLAVFLAIAVGGAYLGDSRARQVLVLVLAAGAGALIVGVPLAVGSQLRLDRDKALSERERERRRVAAHLHDSVLQTLALVQRQADHPVAVARLARRQEHALRAWMAGEAELTCETLAAALRDVVAEVEDEEGIAVELTAIGDRPLDPAGEALAAAAREALRNAAKHAPGAKVLVFAEISERAGEVFVRDDGPGFELDVVAPERRGIRDAIVGRMASVGGRAQVESVPGEGTEVALWVGPPVGGR
jgi:signal transduction histidine kinase